MKTFSLKTEIFLWGIMLAPLVYLALVWDQLPDRVPTHYNLQGEADGWSSKTALIAIVVGTTVGLYMLLLLVPKIDPKRRLKSMGNTYHRLRLLMVAYMAALTSIIIYSATNRNGLNLNLTSILTGILFVILGNYMQAIKPNYFIGIRTPWTLESENVWRKTHRFSGPLFVIGGILYTLTAFIDDLTIRAVLGIPILAIIIVTPVIFSYLESKKDQKMKRNA